MNRWIRWTASGVIAVGAAAARGQQPTTLGAMASRWLEDSRGLAAATWDKAKMEAAALKARAAEEAAKVERPRGVRLLDPADPGHLEWREFGPAAPARIVLLVHGLDEPGDIWDDLAPALARAGYAVARFDYPNDQHIADSAALLGDWMHRLRGAGATRVDLVCHSMGGLVARDALTRPEVYAGRTRAHDGLPDVRRLILLGTPCAGSPWTGLEAVAELREDVVRFAQSQGHDWRELLGLFRENRAGAAEDLAPGSDFLKNLDARAWPEGVAITVVVARIVPPQSVPGAKEDLAAKLGDGIVPEASATPTGVSDLVHITANHRGMVRYGTAERAARALAGQKDLTSPAIPVVLDRLARPDEPPAPVGDHN